MIDTIAKRRMILNGKTYQKGDKVQMPLQQFNDLEPTGMVERAPATVKVTAKTAPKAVRRKPAPTPVVARAAEHVPAVAPALQSGAEKAD